MAFDREKARSLALWALNKPEYKDVSPISQALMEACEALEEGESENRRLKKVLHVASSFVMASSDHDGMKAIKLLNAIDAYMGKKDECNCWMLFSTECSVHDNLPKMEAL